MVDHILANANMMTEVIELAYTLIFGGVIVIGIFISVVAGSRLIQLNS